VGAAIIIDLLARLHALGTIAQSPPVDELPVIGACTRPSAHEREAIRARVLAWSHAVDVGLLRFGCTDKDGTIVETQADFTDRGEWWVLRIGREVGVVAEQRGVPTASFGEWTWESTLEVVALADLDGDGTRDVLAYTDQSEGGSGIHDRTLFAVTAHGRKDIASLGEMIEIDPASTTPVLKLSRRDAAAFRCVDAKLALATCSEATDARHRDEARSAAIELAGLRVVPDADHLADLLAAINAPDRVALVAAAPPTTPLERARRDVERWAHPPDDRTQAEIDAAALASAKTHLAAIRDALGDTDCPAGKASFDAWAKKHAPGKVTIVARCGGFATIEWVDMRDDGLHKITRAVVYASGKTVDVIAEEETGSFGSPDDHREPALAATYTRHGTTAIATILGATELIVAADGKVVERRSDAQRYAIDGVPADALVVTSDARLVTVRHAGPTGTTVVASYARASTDISGDPVGWPIVQAARFQDARAQLAFVDHGKLTADRAATLRALVVLAAPSTLIDEVRALH
jgi:hypothetical protein